MEGIWNGPGMLRLYDSVGGIPQGKSYGLYDLDCLLDSLNKSSKKF